MQKALAQRGLSIQGTEFELLTRLEDALEQEDRLMRSRLQEAKERSRAVKALAFTAKAADKRAEVQAHRIWLCFFATCLLAVNRVV